MKGSYLGLCLVFMGMMFLIMIGGIFEYTALYKSISFELRNALMEASKEAIIPSIECELIQLDEEECEFIPECDENGWYEECYEVYMEENEFMQILMENLRNYRKIDIRKNVDLYYFQNHPLLVRAGIRTHLDSAFINLPIAIEKTILEN